MGRRHRFSQPVTAALVALTVSMVACSDDDGSRDAGADVDTFCARAPDPDEQVPASYVGSGEHVDDLRELAASAPAELRDDLDLVIEHFDEGVDPSDPDSQLVWNFPDEVNAATERLIGYIQQHCPD